MKEQEDNRSRPSVSNYGIAFYKLDQAVTKIKKGYPVDYYSIIGQGRFLSDIIKDGLIHRFKYTHELAWSLMKDFLEDIGNVKVYDSKDATREAFAADLISDGDSWMDMILSQNKTMQTYNEDTADEIFTKIINDYHSAFEAFLHTMETKRSRQQSNLFKDK